jgi:hypothetical protein
MVLSRYGGASTAFSLGRLAMTNPCPAADRTVDARRHQAHEPRRKIPQIARFPADHEHGDRGGKAREADVPLRAIGRLRPCGDAAVKFDDSALAAGHHRHAVA